ncbi:MAG: ABC transporter ATP-binding protein/permease [Chloroflexales bacterium]|nr:ABC transporter ATP-binding protein/permease [Chloroflexales bacterium]
MATSSIQAKTTATNQPPETLPQAQETVRSYAMRRRGIFALSGLLSIIGNAAGLVPYVVIYFIAVEVLGTPFAEVNTNWLWILAGVALGSVVLKAFATGLSTHLSHIAAYDILYDLRIALAEHLGRLHLGYFNGHTTGEIKKIIHEDVEKLEEGLAHIVPDFIGGVIVPILTLIILFTADWRLALATIALLPIAIAMYAWVAARSSMATYNQLNAEMASAVIQYINDMKVLKTFLRANASFQKLRDVAEKMQTYYTGAYAASIPTLAVIFAVVRGNLLLIVPLGVVFYLNGTLTIPTFVLFLVLGIGFNRPIWTLFTNYSMAIWQISVASKRIADLLNTPALAEPAQPQTPADASIVFNNVRFSYAADTATEQQDNAANALTLNDISFTLPAGSVTALVGPSGAGKSTIAKLIPRFWDVTDGKILLGGVDIRQIGTQQLMDQVSFVFQDVFLFNDSVYENIRVGKPGATEEEIIGAAIAARCHDFVLELEQGYQTPIGENGARLSGGQRQRLSIARAILKEAPIVVLDEATAFLDPENEAQVQAALATLASAGKTVVVIAHRLSTITEVDQILVVDGGQLVAQGAHDELLQQSPLYKELWDAHIASQEWQLSRSNETLKRINVEAPQSSNAPTLQRSNAFENPYTDLNPNEHLMRTLFKLVPGQRGDYKRGILWKILDGAVSAWPALVVFLILVELFQQPVNTERIWAYVGVLFALFIGQILFNYLAQRAFMQVIAGMHFDMRLFLADYLRRLPLGFFTRRDTGTIDSLFTTNIMFLDVRMPTDMFISGVVAPSLLFVAMLFIDWRLALAAGIGLPIALFILRATMRVFGQIWTAQRIARTQANSRMVEYIQGISVIRAFNLAGARMGQFQQTMDAYRTASIQTQTKITPAIIGFLSTMEFGYAVVVAVGTVLFLAGTLTGTTFLLFLFLALAFYQPLMFLGELVALQRVTENSVRNLNEFIQTPMLPEPAQGRQPADASVVFGQVRFSYGADLAVAERSNAPTLTDVSFQIPARGVTALVGPSGSGKTTITNLIARFWDIDHGSVRVGGVDVRNLSSETLQSQLTMVFQDVYLFNDAIRNNIAIGKPNATDDEIIAAASAARCHDFIIALPDGYDTMIGEGGATLSGGEKQRISIARALLKDAPIIMLDEATASIDPENEWLIQQAFDALAAEKTVIVIAHRLATLQQADQILVLDEGRLVQQGAHDQLINQKGLYSRFWEERQKARSWKLGAVAAK